MMNLRSRWLVLAVACWMTAAAASADWLVTRNGERIETQGAWQVKGRMVVFTSAAGTLSSMRTAEVDLDASTEATQQAAAAAAAPIAAEPEEPVRKRRSVRVITTEDIGEGVPGAEGTDLLIERLRQAHGYQDVGLAMGLVNWQDVPESMRGDIETQFEWMMERRIRDIRFVPAEPEEASPQQVQDGVAYEPNVEVAGKIEVSFVPDPDQDEVLLTFHVGTRLNSYFLAAPRETSD